MKLSIMRVIVVLLALAWVIYLFFSSHFVASTCSPAPAQIVDHLECYDLLNKHASKCDVRLHFMVELQSYRKRTYDELGVTRPIRMLFFTTKHYYDRQMDRWWFFRFDAATRNPYVEAVLWGPDLPNYNNNETLQQNIAHVYNTSTYFDIIIVGFKNSTYFAQLAELSNTSAIMTLHDEAWCIPGGDNCDRRLAHIPLINVSLIGFAYAFELVHEEWQKVGKSRHFFHIPKTVAAEYFYKPPDPSKAIPATLEEVVAEYDKERDIDVLFISAVHYRVYPLRWKVTCMYKSGYFDSTPYKFYFHGHPGYMELTNDSFNATMAKDQINHYASLMRRAKIVVTDSSRYRYAVGKYAEIPASGALILGDMPDERENDFKFYVARMNHKMTPKELIDTITYWLENPVKRYQRARLGQILTLQNAGICAGNLNFHYVKETNVPIQLMVQAYLNFKQNKIGLFYNYPYSDTCRATSVVHMREYCVGEDASDRANEAADNTPEHGWYLPPKNCTSDFGDM